MNPPSKKPKTQNQNQNEDSLLEQLRDIGRGTVKNFTKDLVGGVTQDALKSLFGTPQSGELKPNQPLSLDQPPDQPAIDNEFYPEMPFGLGKPKKPEIKPDPYLERTIAKFREQEQLVAQKIEEIRIELKSLIAALKNVDLELVNAVEEQVVDPGTYHLNFLDRLRTILKLMRQNINDSASWLRVMRSRKKERRFWSMFKKRGTEFGLSNERVVAQQVG